MNSSTPQPFFPFHPDMSQVLQAMNRLASDNLPELTLLGLTDPWAAYARTAAIQRAGLRSWAESCQQAFDLAERALIHGQQSLSAFEPRREG